MTAASLFAAAIQGSNTIEHITISSSDARALVEHAPMSAETSEGTRQAVVGYRDAMTYVRQTPLLEIAHAATAAVRGPGRDPYARS
ncbi:hypothetical protein [Actinoplanes sp. ATCC 53533]|uniref:hypothetical protein n=1 Tax=Actinoplanes sp. ATCC 53533 TaxID=1288362 RepID=UPI0018F435E1|nr:hypothetical protein [Actinoplanes sp. ATCC 53533]